MEFINYLFDQFNPERLPIDTVEDEDKHTEELIWFQYQFRLFMEKVRIFEYITMVELHFLNVFFKNKY